MQIITEGLDRVDALNAKGQDAIVLGDFQDFIWIMQSLGAMTDPESVGGTVTEAAGYAMQNLEEFAADADWA